MSTLFSYVVMFLSGGNLGAEVLRSFMILGVEALVIPTLLVSAELKLLVQLLTPVLRVKIVGWDSSRVVEHQGG